MQRGNAEMQRRAQEVIDRCWQLGDANPVLSIHDVGAGRAVERRFRAGSHRGPRREDRSARAAERRAGDDAARAVVQRGAGTLRPRGRP